jgi:SHS2 domain-containing protein
VGGGGGADGDSADGGADGDGGSGGAARACAAALAAPCLWDSEASLPSPMAAPAAEAPASSAAAPAPVPEEPESGQWEFLDHTADVLVHAWGGNLAEALGQAALALWAHLVDRRAVRCDYARCAPRTVRAAGKDLLDLLFNFLDACLYAYGSDYFLARRVRVTHLSGSGVGGGEDAAGGGGGMLHIEAQCFGELFDTETPRHRDAQGTEIKAITYSSMAIFTADGRVLRAGVGLHSDSHGELPAVAEAAPEVAPAAAAAAEAERPRRRAFDEGDAERPKGERKGAVDLYVVVDI